MFILQDKASGTRQANVGLFVETDWLTSSVFVLF